MSGSGSQTMIKLPSQPRKIKKWFTLVAIAVTCFIVGVSLPFVLEKMREGRGSGTTYYPLQNMYNKVYDNEDIG